MSKFEIISTVIASSAMLVSLIALVMSVIATQKANAMQASANAMQASANKTQNDALELQKTGIKLQAGSVELEIRNSIDAAEARPEQIATEYRDIFGKERLTAEEEIKKKAGKAALKSAIEAIHNAYDEACAKYIDKKVPGARFKASYARPIQRLVEQDKLGEFAKPDCQYQAILAVYREWNIVDVDPNEILRPQT